MMHVHVDCFSGKLAELKKEERTLEAALAVLSRSPLVSTWDMSELPWLRGLVEALVHKGWIDEEKEGYPWHRFVLTTAGRAKLQTPEGQMDLSDEALQKAYYDAEPRSDYLKVGLSGVAAYVLEQVADDLDRTGTMFGEVANAYRAEASKLKTDLDVAGIGGA